MVQVLMRDMAKDKQTDAFFGKGTEDLIRKAEAEGKDIIVGEYFDKPYIDD
jgi:hypothetical protein